MTSAGGWADLRAALAARGVALEAGAVERLAAFGALLLEANARLNLTRITSPEDLLEKHVVDALLALPALEEGRAAGVPPPSLVDVGSGGGVPGLVLAIARPAWRVTLVEATAKKAAFLEAASAALGLGATVRCARAEAVARDPACREGFDLAVARAVGAISTVLELTLPLVAPGGRVVLYRGPQDAEAEDAQAAAVAPLLGGGAPAVRTLALPSGAPRRLVVVPKVAPTDARYPRRDGVPTKRPL